MSEVNTRSINGIELPPAGAYAFDQAHTTVGFVARHMLSKVHGRFTAYDGQVKIADAVEDSSVNVEIKADSITTDNEGRDEHLRSSDFFEIETYPTLSFTSTAFRPGKDRAFELEGDLSVRGVTRPVTLKGEFLGWGPGLRGGTIASFTAATTIDREEFGLTWNMAVETGGWLVGKKIDIVIDADLVLED